MTRMMRAALAIAATLAALPAAAAVPTTADYLAKAGASDLFERESGKLVLETSRNPAVRRFATMMVADHRDSARLVADAAAQSGYHPAPPTLSARQLRLMADLTEARGDRRDELYIEQQKAAHDAALALQQDYALDGGVPAIKAAAARIVPVVQRHAAVLEDLHAR